MDAISYSEIQGTPFVADPDRIWIFRVAQNLPLKFSESWIQIQTKMKS